jgi:hypothetical protein
MGARVGHGGFAGRSVRVPIPPPPYATPPIDCATLQRKLVCTKHVTPRMARKEEH